MNDTAKSTRSHPCQMRQSAWIFVLALLLAVLLTACAPDDAPVTDDAPATDDASATVAVPDPAWGPPVEPEVDAELEARIDALMERMTLEQKVGQIIQAEIKHATPEDVQRYGLGSVLNGGGSFPDLDRHASLEQWTNLADAYQEASRQPMQEGLPVIPLLWGTDAVHGHNNVYGATVFPHNIGLGATRNPELVRAINEATALDVRATGIDWNFSPTVAVARDLRWGRTYESFSSDPELVTMLGEAAILGLQGKPGDEDWLGPNRILATAKHFVGDGGTHEGVDQGDTRLSEAELAEIHGLPYLAAIAAEVQTVMASFSSWNGEKLHGHHYLMTEVLKNTLGFDGFVIGDWNGHGQVAGCTVTDCLQALEAGIDMFMVPEDWLEFRNTLLEHARNDRLPMDRLDDAVRRILRVKHRAGLFDRDGGTQPRTAGLGDHSELARRAVRESLVLLKNNDDLLPLHPGQRIAVVGDGADDIGKQSGGWTLDWQGVTESNESFPNGRSIYDGIAEQATANGGQVHLGEAGLLDFSPDVVIAVFGEDPYSEGHGDLETLEFQPGTREDLDMLDRLAELEAPVVTVFLSGRPLWVNPHLNRSDAFVAAWLPGTEGDGVADVLLADDSGQAQYGPTGKLPFAWPASPLPDAEGGFPTLFEFGFGLGYEDSGELELLPEDGMSPRSEASSAEDDVVLFDGNARGPWQLAMRETVSGEWLAVDAQIARTPAGGIVITPTDRRLQGDARRVRWTDSNGDSLMLTADEAVDLRALHERNASMAFDLRIESGARDALLLGLECGPDCVASLALDEVLDDFEVGQWRRLSVDLACFEAEGADLSQVSSVFVMSATQPVELSLADIRMGLSSDRPRDIECSD